MNIRFLSILGLPKIVLGLRIIAVTLGMAQEEASLTFEIGRALEKRWVCDPQIVQARELNCGPEPIS